ncbi:S-Ena type endospore appendage [Bacillus sp. AFS088145]|uniref:S-Ena type endospore appendage n=1 Tax=Bacillus sp. AFS088145 TaxID=2033514 RepID=UPI00115578CB|nr:S-Ena type endospore appendage [Bacillus sp. AFS088145]
MTNVQACSGHIDYYRPITIEVSSNISHIITVLPGNTSNYTSQHIKSVTIVQSGQTPIYLEGKYCITGKIIDK